MPRPYRCRKNYHFDITGVVIISNEYILRKAVKCFITIIRDTIISGFTFGHVVNLLAGESLACDSQQYRLLYCNNTNVITTATEIFIGLITFSLLNKIDVTHSLDTLLSSAGNFCQCIQEDRCTDIHPLLFQCRLNCQNKAVMNIDGCLGDKINDSSTHSLHTFVSHIFTVIILPSQGHTMHNCRSKSRHWLTTESHLGHTDCPPSLAHIYTAKLFHMFHEHNQGKECTAHMLHPASQGYTFKSQHYFSDNM